MDPNIWTVVSLWYRPIVAHSYKQRAPAGLEHFVDGVSIKLKCFREVVDFVDRLTASPHSLKPATRYAARGLRAPRAGW